MTEFLRDVHDIKQLLESGVHLFCPRQNDDDVDRYEDHLEDASGADPQRQAILDEARRRREKVVNAMQVLAYDGEECITAQRYLWDALDLSLGKCDICIREYYIAKIAFHSELRQSYEEDDIDTFFSIIDRRDVARIEAGLADVTRVMKETPENKRGPNALPKKALHALFEALICEVFLQDEKQLTTHFDEPFKLIQTKKRLKMREVLPAATRFLFSTNPLRIAWASDLWNNLGRPPTEVEWDWAIKNTLEAQLQSALDPPGVARLWSALKVIVSTLDEKTITHKLCDLVPGVCKAALDYLAKSTPAVPFITQTMGLILQTAPEAYWGSMGSIPTSAIIEAIFNSPQFDRCLQTSVSGPDSAEDTNLSVLSWIIPLLLSLKLANRPAAAHAIVDQLFSRINRDSTSGPAKVACFNMAVRVIARTLMSFSDDENSRRSVERLVLSDTLQLTGQRLTQLLNPKDPELKIHSATAIKVEVTSIVRNAVALECQCLKTDFEILTKGEHLRHANSFTIEIWDALIDNLHEDDVELSSAAMLGIVDLPGLDKFCVRDRTENPDQKTAYNETFDKLSGKVADMLERIRDFKPDHLDHLYREQNVSMQLIAALFSPDQRVYEAAVDLVKSIAGEPGRKEAMAHLLNAFLGTTLYSICWILRRVSNMKAFSSVPRILKTGMEILDVLCNPTDGQLRKAKLNPRDLAAVQSYWSYQWIALRVIYSQTEHWAMLWHDRNLMSDMCRDAMDYAEALFGHYDLFASILIDGNAGKPVDVPKMLLDASDKDNKAGSPLKTIDMMAKWLRLRDQWLAEKLVSVLCNMLPRLKQNQAIVADSEGLSYAANIATSNSIRTNLVPAEKARLRRALEQYFDKPIGPPPVKKQSTLNDWKGSVAREDSRSSTPTMQASAEQSLDEFGDDDIADEDLIELERAGKTDTRKQSAQRDSQPARPLPTKPRPKSTMPSISNLQAKQAADAKAFIENRKREAAARKAREKEIALKLRGNVGMGQQTGGQGSGLAGLGVQGTDHSVPNSLMVSSESESEDDSEDELFGKLPKLPTAVRNQQGQRKHLQPTGPVRKLKRVQTQKDIRARLAPDLSDLHKIILGWEFFADTDLPPSSTQKDYTLVTNKFKTPTDYQKTFEPLLVLEGWQSFRSAREDGTFTPFEVKIANSLIVDNFFEINTVMSMAEGRELSITPSDVVLLSTSKTPHRSPNDPHCLARVKEVNRKRGEMQIVYRVNASSNPLRPFLNDKSSVCGVQILSLTPLEREYGALMALPYYDLCDEIINAQPSPLLAYTDKDVENIGRTYGLNNAQARAIKSALDNDAFTLIQGPPGSGKTKTITGLVGAMMTGHVQKQADGPRLNTSSLKGGLPPPPATKKILVCAPSNAAVDELVMRLKLEIRMLDGSKGKLNVVRLGRSDAINANVKDVTLEELVNTQLNLNAPKDPKEDIHAVMMEHKSCSDRLAQLNEKTSGLKAEMKPVPPEDDQLRDGLRKKKADLSAKIDKMRESQTAASRDAELTRKRLQQQILDSAHVLCATLSGSGHEIFQSLNVEFETVIIDEAAQSIELSALIPLKYGCSKCILVGDPKQLPPTVLSRTASKFQYEQSLFARMENNHKKDVHLLDTQYRMHPHISLFPSRTFYDSRLKDGDDMARLTKRPWHAAELFAPYRFFDVQGMSQSTSKGHSLVNVAELNVAMQLYERLTADVPRYNFRGKVGIITPYKGQLRELRLRFKQRYGEEIMSSVEFNTTDAFQGREAEIIIFSCVRASTQGIGFLRDIRRMNVGLTRAKCSLWVLGNSESLIQGEFWRALVDDAKRRNLYTEGDIMNMLKRPQLTADMIQDDVEMIDADMASETVPASRSGSSSGVQPTSSPQMPSAPLRSHDVKRRQSASSDSSMSVPSKSASDQGVQKATKSVPERKPSITNRPGVQLGKQAAVSRAGPPPQRPKRDDSTSSVERKNHNTAPPTRSKREQRSHDSMNLDEPALKRQRVPTDLDSKELKPESKSGNGLNERSGGWNGLNELATCSNCGSAMHRSWNCDNEAAKAASIGTCDRCGSGGHKRASCNAPRCLSCGEVGHSTSNCDAPPEKRLDEKSTAQVRKDEISHQRLRDAAIKRRAERQKNEHDVKIPEVKTSTATTTTTNHPPAPAKSTVKPGQPLVRKKKKPDADDLFTRRR